MAYYIEGLRRAGKLDEKIGVAVCVVPDEVWTNCRSRSYVADPIGPPVPGKTVQARKAGQLDFFREYDPEQYWLSPDFRRQLKARAMEFGIPLWYSPTTKQFHLSREAARSLLEGTLKTYADLEGKALTEVFLHSRSEISDEESAGYQEACPPNVKLVGVRVQLSRYGPRLYRADGKMPVIRGTFWRINERSGFLWGSGFKPRVVHLDA